MSAGNGIYFSLHFFLVLNLFHSFAKPKAQISFTGISGGGGQTYIIRKDVYYVLSLALGNFANSLSCQKQSNGECPWDMFIPLVYLSVTERYVGCYTYRRGRLALFVSARWAMRRPLRAG